MCGIFGAIKLQGLFTEVDNRKFKELTDIIAYRGPDSSGYKTLNTYQENNSNNDFNIFLGHRRLSIIDLSENGAQPMQSDNLHIIFNGEIFNYVELREELKQKGHHFKTATDTEVILKTYLEYGEKGFANFNGMWAIILVDIAKKRIVISRDRFSMKPLYYHNNGESIYFASEIKQLLPLLKTKQVNKKTLFAFIQQALVEHTTETFFEGIEKIKAKHNMLINLISGDIEQFPYWDYEPEQVSSIQQAEERFRELFYDSVKLRLRSDVKVGSLLSGGLDSSAITVAADSFQHGNFESFSIVAKEKKYSEEFFIDLLVKEKKLANRKFIFESEMVPTFFDEVMYHQDEPFGSFSAIAQYLIFKKIKEKTGIIVVLSGQGGDEALMGYNKYFFFYLKHLQKQGKYAKAANEIMRSLWHRTVLTNINLGHARRYVPSLVKKNTSYLRFNEPMEEIWKFDTIEKRQQQDFDNYSVPALARYEDRNSMAFGLEVRHPFLDHRLINLSLGLKTDMKMHNGWTKYLLRSSLTELPDGIRWRRDKKGFITPDEKWLKEDLQPQVFSSFKNSVLHDMGIIDKTAFLTHYKNFIKPGSTLYFNDIFRVMAAELWVKKNFIQ